MIKKICNAGVKIVEIISIFAISLMLIFTVYEVFAREILNRPTIWTNEITSYMLVWFGMLAIAYAFDQKAHVSVDLVYRKLNARLQKGLDLFSEILVLFFSLFICFYGYKYWWLGYSRGWRHMGMLDIPMSYTRIALPLTGILLFLLVLRSIYDRIGEIKQQATKEQNGME
jgi:TRAP-type C4-dicarboxylate transport system permease small subunit